MRTTRRRKKISSAEALREEEGAGQKVRERGRSRHSQAEVPEALLVGVALPGEPAQAAGPAWLRDLRRGALEEAPPALPREARSAPVQHRRVGLALWEQALAARRPVSGQPAVHRARVAGSRQVAAAKSLPVLARQPKPAPGVGRRRKRPAAKRAAPRRREHGKLRPSAAGRSPRGRPNHADRAVAARNRGPRAARGDSFSFPRAQCPRRGYSQVTALFP